MNTLAFYGLIGWLEGLVLLAIALLIFSRRIPDLAGGLGQGLRGLTNRFCDRMTPETPMGTRKES